MESTENQELESLESSEVQALSYDDNYFEQVLTRLDYIVEDVEEIRVKQNDILKITSCVTFIVCLIFLLDCLRNMLKRVGR